MWSAGLVLLGMASAVSLLVRHWRSIEAAAAPADELGKEISLLGEPLLVGRSKDWGIQLILDFFDGRNHPSSLSHCGALRRSRTKSGEDLLPCQHTGAMPLSSCRTAPELPKPYGRAAGRRSMHISRAARRSARNPARIVRIVLVATTVPAPFRDAVPSHCIQEDDAELEGGSPLNAESRGAHLHDGELPEGSVHRRISRVGSVGALYAISPLDFFKSVSDGDTTLLLDRHSYVGGVHVVFSGLLLFSLPVLLDIRGFWPADLPASRTTSPRCCWTGTATQTVRFWNSMEQRPATQLLTCCCCASALMHIKQDISNANCWI